jgi:hypothetical protein
MTSSSVYNYGTTKRERHGYVLPPALMNHYELRNLQRYSGRLYTRIWLSLKDNAGFDSVWFSREQISLVARIPLDKLDAAQRECIEAGLLVIRPAPLDRYELARRQDDRL